MMSHQQHPSNKLRLIGWLLIASLLAMLLVPYHYHLSHIDNPNLGTPSHQIDLHRAADSFAPHHFDHGTHTVDPASVDMSQPNNQHMPFLAILFVFALLISATAAQRQNIDPRTAHRLPGALRHHSPPLRAPPTC